MYNLSVLYVEDNRENRELFSEILQEKVKEIFVSDDAMNAIEIYKKNKIDLIIADIKMPKMDGLTMCQEIKKINGEAKIILLTGSSDSKNLLKAINLGIDTYLLKPLEYKRLNSELNKFNKIINYEKEQARINALLNENYENASCLLSTYETVINESNIIIKLNRDYEIIDVNNSFCQLTNYLKNELKNKSFFIFEKSLEYKDKSKEKFLISYEKGLWKGKLSIVDKLGNTLDLIATISSIKDKKGNFKEYLLFIQDITEVIKMHTELEEAQREIIYKMGEIVESKSKETGLHVKRVAEYSKLLALKSGMNLKEAELLKHASPMHDVGKIAINDSILHKTGKLTFEEFERMKEHTNIGYELLNNSNIDILRVASIISREHHEKWDGSGYPRKLSGNDIHIYGRITAIADVFDALGSDRSYKKAWDLDDILNFFKGEKGKHFDPFLIDVFFENLNEFLEIRERFKEN